MATDSQIGKANRVHFLCLTKSPSHANKYANRTIGITATLSKIWEIKMK